MKIYIIGYGSLLNINSVQRTLKNVTYIEPIYLTHYQRSWNAIDDQSVSLSPTYLGIEYKENATLNAVIFEIDISDLDMLDKREFLYHRVTVDKKNIKFLENNKINITNDDKIYMYLTTNPKEPNKDYPIIQSYVDTCMIGCYQLEKQFNLNTFLDDFLTTTHKWSSSWVNDRIFPRAPHIHNSYAYDIDRAINKILPNYFKSITIE